LYAALLRGVPIPSRISDFGVRQEALSPSRIR
jgi:hypothetical protein